MSTVKHECVRCGKRASVDKMVFSRHTRSRYCRDFKACDRRYARLQTHKAVPV